MSLGLKGLYVKGLPGGLYTGVVYVCTGGGLCSGWNINIMGCSKSAIVTGKGSTK